MPNNNTHHSPANALYLDLLKKGLLNEFGLENELRTAYVYECLSQGRQPALHTARDIHIAWKDRYSELQQERRDGQRWRPREQRRAYPFSVVHYPFTLIGRKRLDNIEACLDTIRLDGIPGDCLEAGVWRGGATIFMRGYLKAYNITDRLVWVADSFQGLPPPQHALEKL